MINKATLKPIISAITLAPQEVKNSWKFKIFKNIKNEVYPTGRD